MHLFDSKNEAIWVDTGNILINKVTMGINSFVVASSRNTCFIHKKTDSLLSSITGPRTLGIRGYHPRMQYPKHEPCRRVGVSLRNPKSEKA